MLNRILRPVCLLMGLAVLPFGSASDVLAQPGGTLESPSRKQQTQVSFELLMVDRVPPLAAQQWGEIFRRVGASVRIRQALSSDRTEVSETTRGSLRQVKATGLL